MNTFKQYCAILSGLDLVNIDACLGTHGTLIKQGLVQVDSLLTDRLGSTQSWKTSQVNELSYQMENFNGVMSAATNQFEILDKAVIRRFDLRIQFNWLKPSHAEQILSNSLETLNLKLSMIACNRLKELTRFAHSEFALVLCQCRFLPVYTDQKFIDRLCEKQKIKARRSRSMGFVPT